MYDEICANQFTREKRRMYCTLPIGHSGPCGKIEDHKREEEMAEIPDSRVDDPISPAAEISGQERVMARAIDIYDQHSKDHGDLWTEADILEIAAQVKHKGNRAYYASRRYEEGKGKDRARARLIDSALDCINYCGFLIQQVEKEDGDDN